MVTSPGMLKAFIRLASILGAIDAEPEEGRVRRWESRFAPWSELVPDLRVEGFYQRYPAKGQAKLVEHLQSLLGRRIGL